jgi:predicted amidohydrolase YtcJ
MRKTILIAGAAFFALVVSASMPRPQAAITLAIVNARVWTGDPKQPWADAVAVSGARIAAVGSSASIQKLTDANTKVIDAKGGLVTPGFIDSHVHFIGSSFGLTSVQLRTAATPAEFAARLKAYAAKMPKGAWILGGDWDHSLWGGELPNKSWIDSVTPDNPVWVTRLDGHMSLANSLALAAAKVTKDTKDPAGGRIVRAPNGDPTGILKDNAQSLVDDVIPDPPADLADKALQNGMQYVASHGVTSVVNMGYTWWDLGVFQRAQKAGKLITRFYAVAPLRTWEQLRDTVYKRGHGDEWIQIGGLKAFVDGSIGSHTALMLRPFNDAPNDSGLWVTPADDLYAWTSGADRAGLQVMVHAIGDRAIRTQLDIFARVEKENGPRDRRFRIEHAQHLSPQDIPRFAELGVIPSMQPYHAIDDGRWVDTVIGRDRSRYTYAFRSLIDAKATVAFGSDWSVAPAIPLYGIYAAVTRRTLDDKNPGGWVPEEKITVEEALRAYTINGAYAEFQEKEKGSIEVGKLADFAFIDRDITTIPPETIRDAKVIRTIVGGVVVFDVARTSPCGGDALPDWAVTKPVVPSGPAPKHPRSISGQGGGVTVRFIVDSTGKMQPGSLKVTAATNSGFVDAVQDVMPKWKFVAAELNGHKVAQCVELPFTFEIQP